MTRDLKNQNRFILFYKRNFMNVELGIAIIATIIILYLLPTFIAPIPLNDWVLSIKGGLYPVVATISGALLGFVITGVSIILAFSESDKLTRLKNSKQYKNLYRVYFRAIDYLAATTIISIFGVIITLYSTIWFYIFVLSSIISLFGLYRCIWVLERIVGIVHKK